MEKTIECYKDARRKWQEGAYCLDELIWAMEKNDVSLIIRRMKKMAEINEETRVLVKKASISKFSTKIYFVLNMELK